MKQGFGEKGQDNCTLYLMSFDFSDSPKNHYELANITV